MEAGQISQHLGIDVDDSILVVVVMSVQFGDVVIKRDKERENDPIGTGAQQTGVILRVE